MGVMKIERGKEGGGSGKSPIRKWTLESKIGSDSIKRSLGNE